MFELIENINKLKGIYKVLCYICCAIGALIAFPVYVVVASVMIFVAMIGNFIENMDSRFILNWRLEK